MASISAPCPKCSVISHSQSSRGRNLKQQSISLSTSKPSFLAGSARITRFQEPQQIQFPILKAQVREASAEDSSKTSALPSTKLDSLSSDGKDPKVVEDEAPQSALSESTISAFMAEVSDIVKLVDSRDIIELRLKQMDCELIIRKKEAFAQTSPTAPVVMMQPSQQPMLPPQLPMSHPTPAASPPSTPVTLPPPSKGSKSSLPPLKCPMAGTFYRSPAPGEPSFVKVGDKVQKGQVVCIIEAMKLMNEIEADQSGTVVEIIAEDGKPVSVDTPLLVIQP